MARLLSLCIFVFVSSISNALAQSNDEIVVTGTRLTRFSGDIVPSVYLHKKPDYVLVSYEFINDTRAESTRNAELSKSLNDMIKKASRRSDIELSTVVEYEDGSDTLYVTKPYTAVDENEFTKEYRRDDTSMMTVTVKTPVDENIHSIEQAAERIEMFVESVTLYGRTLADDDGEVQLSVVRVGKYRDELVGAIVAKAKSEKAKLGASSATLSKMEQVVRWERDGPLSLKVYIPYALTLEFEE